MARVLIVDDHLHETAMLEEELKRRGHCVSYSGCGVGAQLALRSEHPDYAIFDGNIPRFEGEGHPSEEHGAVFLAREAKRKSPKTRCVAYSLELSDRAKDELDRMKVPYFIKGQDSIYEVLKALGV